MDLGSTNIKIAGIRKKGDVFQLEFYDVIDLIKEYSLSSLSEINDDLYIEQLRNLVSKYHLRNADANATLPANCAIIHNLKLSLSEIESDITEIILQELRQASLEQIDEMQIACQQLDEPHGPEDQISLLVCAVPNSVVERYLKILTDCGFKVSVLDLDAMGVYNAFYFFLNKKLSFPVTAVNIGSQYTICIIMQPGKTPFFYVIKLGDNNITSKIMEELCLTLSKAEILKRRIYRPKWTNSGAYHKSSLSEILAEFANNIVFEVKRCLRHYQSREGVAEIGKIYLTGGGAKTDLLVNLFHEKLNIRTELWNPLNFFKITSPQQDEQIRQLLGIQLTPTIGTLLRGD